METLFIALLSWIVANSTYAMPTTLPKIEYRTEIEMRRMHLCENVEKCDDATLPEIHVAALYDHKPRLMYLSEGFDPEDPRNKATLVHELTHHLQGLAGKFVKDACIGPLEREAYNIENRWLASQHFPVPEMTLAQMMAQSCFLGPT